MLRKRGSCECENAVRAGQRLDLPLRAGALGALGSEQWLGTILISSLSIASKIWWLFCAKSTWELSETTAACIMPVQTVQVLAQVSSVRCMNNLVDSKDSSHAFTIRHVLVPVAEVSQKPTSAVTPCYFCLWCLLWFLEEASANTGPSSNVFTYAEYRYLTLPAFSFT